MTYQDIFSMLNETNMPVAYDHFDTPQTLPFVVFVYPNNNDFIADNSNYVEIVNVTIHLYTERKSIATERVLENVLKAHDLVYTKASVWVETEQMQETIYEVEILING